MIKLLKVLAIILVFVLLVPLLPACSKAQTATAYTAIIPAVLQAGSKQLVSVALFAGQTPTSGQVSMAIVKDGQEISRAKANINKIGDFQLDVPTVPEGEYTLKLESGTLKDEAKVKIANNFLIILETDKPIYKPGQTLHMRLMTLDSQLQPTAEGITVDVLDAKGIKIFRSVSETDEFGMTTIDLPLSEEPNLGTWKISAVTPKTKTEIDVKVEEYVLPKYEVKVDLPKEWFLVNEPIKGKVTATYSFGKPVVGNLTVKATKYVGTWQAFAEVHLDINGQTDFTIPAAQYVAGVPAEGGNGNVKLEFTVEEPATGYIEKSDCLLTVTQSALNLKIIPAGLIFKPGLPYSFIVFSETPDKQLVDTPVKIAVSYLDENFKEIKNKDYSTNTIKGKALIEIAPPEGCAALTISCSAKDASATRSIEAAYSPTGNFIHLEQTSAGTSKVGDEMRFWVYSTKEAKTFYYEVISRGMVVFSSFTQGNEFILKTTPAMAPSSRLLVYQILPNSEIAADYLPFDVTASYPHSVTLELNVKEAVPGQEITVNLQTEGAAEVGLAAVDKSVFILAENRMNLQQVFDKLEALYMNPQAELHEVSIYDEGITVRGAKDVFTNAGVIVLSNQKIPEGKKYASPVRNGGIFGLGGVGGKGILPPMAANSAGLDSAPARSPTSTAGLAEVQRVRQFFPETWIWDTVKTGSSGKTSLKYTVPDTITTWMLRAVAISKTKGLGVAENSLLAFQPFFLTADLPYSAIRGEEFPLSVAIYNYLDQPQDVVVSLDKADWFTLLDTSEKTVHIAPNEIGSAKFQIKPTKLGTNGVKVTARSPQAADAVIKTLIVEAEGVAKEVVNNITLSNGQVHNISTALPDSIVEGSGRTYLAITSSYLTQTLNGLESLIQMPFGCGEQNMINFAPDVYITRYLKESGQLKPEIMAKAEKLMITGYQREMTYRRTNGSFSAFGQSDKEGSLWLTAFVLKCFSEAKDLIYIDETVLNDAKTWILSHQNKDGSFDSVGFVHHQELLGGLQGQTALTAYVTIALLQAGETTGSAASVRYLETQLNKTDDPYTVALMTYALELAGSGQKNLAYSKLMKLAIEDENGLHWGADTILPVETGAQPNLRMMPVMPKPQTSTIETTAYAALALIKHNDNLNAGRAAKWLVSKRNAFGGFGSTQDTVMALQALIQYSSGARADVDLNVNVKYSGKTQTLKINSQNFDILQIVELPENTDVIITVNGKGEAIGQIVQRFNLPQVVSQKTEILKIDVNYNTDQVAVNDEVKVSVNLSFNPPEPMEAGMVVIDVAVPTGFVPIKASIEQILSKMNNIKRYDIAGRKVIFYLENMKQGEKVTFTFQIKAQYPVKAKGAASQAYGYYKPDLSSESLGRDITVIGQ